MRIIDVPAAVSLSMQQEDGSVAQKPYGLRTWLQLCCDNSRRLSEGGPRTARQGAKIAEILSRPQDPKTADVLRFEDAEYEVVADAVTHWVGPAGLKRLIVSFYDAVEKAQEVKV